MSLIGNSLEVLPNPHDNYTKEELTNGFSKLFVIDNALSNELCDALIEHGTSHVVYASNKHTNNAFKIDVSTCFLDRNSELSKQVNKELTPAWLAAMDHFGIDISFIEPYELKMYENGGFYSQHQDNYHGLNIPVDRKISMSIQLNGDDHYTGGALKFWGNNTASGKKGSMTFFPSFYSHRVEPVQSGTRWVMISWAWGPTWR